MQFYLKPEGGPRLFFTVLDDCGRPDYEVRGVYSSVGCRLALCGPEGKTEAHLTGVCLPDLTRYAASSGAKRLRIWVRPDAARRAVQFRGAEWRFRGSVLTRSFDVVERRAGETSVVMTHGRCWNGGHDCYAVTIRREADVPLALCAAVAVDLAVVVGCALPIPAG